MSLASGATKCRNVECDLLAKPGAPWCSLSCAPAPQKIPPEQLAVLRGKQSKKPDPAPASTSVIRTRPTPAPEVCIDAKPAVISMEDLADGMEAEQRAEMEKRWRRYIEEAKPMVVNLCKARIEIAELAVKACQINYGGGNHWKSFEGVYTLTRFAEEIGINPKTLSEWVATYRNVISKLPEGTYVENFFEAARRVKNKTDRNTPPEKINELYQKELRSSGDREQLLRGVKRFRTLDFYICFKADLSKLLEEAPDELAQLESLCESVLEKIRSARGTTR